ncbi:MAG: hypothetical protein COA44_05315 [Arcobacter sp.]|nr:MAG: hypothetical protein COA44_05315 [Arcobacter sp.]
MFSLAIYISKGANALNKESLMALKEVFYFSFPISFSLSLILMFLLVFKEVFFHNIGRYRLYLYDCKDECIEKPLLSDVTMLWRKWLFVTLWIILIILVIFLGLYKLFTGGFPIEWINGWSLTFLIFIFGGLVFSFGLSRCKKVRIKDA